MMSATQTPEASGLTAEEVEFQKYIDEQISDLESVQARLVRLKSIRAAMSGKVTATNGATPKRRPRKGDRLTEFVNVVTESPGITISEAAKKMDAAPNYLYRLKTRGVAENRLRVEGSNVFPVEGEAKAA
jgi:hypothetical protein